MDDAKIASQSLILDRSLDHDAHLCKEIWHLTHRRFFLHRQQSSNLKNKNKKGVHICVTFSEIPFNISIIHMATYHDKKIREERKRSSQLIFSLFYMLLFGNF